MRFSPTVLGVCLLGTPMTTSCGDIQTTRQTPAPPSAPEFSDVFIAGRDSFPSIRIPSVIVSKKGTVLAFAEGRAAHADQAVNRLILKRSGDAGRTWDPLQVIADDSPRCLNNPCAVVERGSGRVLVMFQSYPAGAAERSPQIKPGVEGDSVVRNYLIHSDDDGLTWSKPRDITRSTKRPERVTTVASGPGIGIQLRRGPHKGRLLIPFNEGPFDHWNVYAVYSDDGGETWQMGEVAPGAHVPDGKGGTTSQANEAQIVELADGSVRLNSRRWAGKPVRKTSLSRDGGATWSNIEDAPELMDPSCMASIVRYSDPLDGAKSRLLFSGPQSAKRDTGTVFLSENEGATWPVKRVLWPGSFAYSVLTVLPDGTIGCLFETDNTDRIVFARFTLAWLRAGKDTLAPIP